jgi:hypothetical protein
VDVCATFGLAQLLLHLGLWNLVLLLLVLVLVCRLEWGLPL